MDKETVIKMIDDYLTETNISKDWREALTFCRRELTKATTTPPYINHPLCDACRDYGDIYYKDCNNCEVRKEIKLMTTIEYMRKQLSKHKVNLNRCIKKNAPEYEIQNVKNKISHYEKACEALEAVKE